MNQILNIKPDKEKNDDDINIDENVLPKKKKLFNIQFSLSIIAILITLSSFLFYKFSLSKKENFSDLLINNYNISKLYSENTNTSNQDYVVSDDTVLGVIEIPSLTISYPFFAGLNDDLLKKAPCRFFGALPSENSNEKNNLCIAGHNYDNNKFFSNVKKLQVDNQIIIHDNFSHSFTYSVFKNYEVNNDDLSPIYTNFTNGNELTLVTCNNFNNKRIIIKAKLIS